MGGSNGLISHSCLCQPLAYCLVLWSVMRSRRLVHPKEPGTVELMSHVRYTKKGACFTPCLRAERN